MLTRLLELIFGCQHSNRSFPLTPKNWKKKPKAAKETGTYQVCLDCGKEFSYDWENLGLINEEEQHETCFDNFT